MFDKVLRHKYFFHVIIIAVIILAIYIFVRKKQKEKEFVSLMEEINDKSNATGTAADLSSSSAFDENYWRKFPDFSKKNGLGGKEGAMVKRIYDDKGAIYDNEKDVISLFSSLKTKSQVSYLAWQFNLKYKQKLIDYLNSFMDNSIVAGKGGTNYMAQLNDIINRMPNN